MNNTTLSADNYLMGMPPLTKVQFAEMQKKQLPKILRKDKWSEQDFWDLMLCYTEPFNEGDWVDWEMICIPVPKLEQYAFDIRTPKELFPKLLEMISALKQQQ